VPVADRVAEVRREIARSGTYRHTATELEHGARTAWRDSARCIGRLYWRSLVVRDARHVTPADGMVAECLEHLRFASNGGRVRPTMTVFPQAAPDGTGPRILGDQLIRYAGYRNLADVDRYDLLPEIARRMGLDTTSDRTMWKNRALVELNVAVLHSFDRAGVTVADHHSESERFLTRLAREEAAGRVCPADWSWIVPPISGSATPVFHRYFDESVAGPRFRSAAEPTTNRCPHRD
jgi:nitric oxide synthase oxygenase domain/subunit